MKRKLKGKVNHKKRVRFCSLDYFKTLVTDSMSDIEGITYYFCDTSYIQVMYDSGLYVRYNVNEGEKQLKEVIKIINAYIGGRGDGTQQ